MKINTNNVSLRISAGNRSQFPRDAIPQIAFCGRSNVGKSSLVNCLLGRNALARVSSVPGKTVTVNFFDIDKKMFFVDLPGYGFAKRSGEKRSALSKVTDDYFTNNPSSDLIKLAVQLVDSRIGPTADDVNMIEYLMQVSIPFVIVATKTDKLSASEFEASMAQIYESVKAAEVPLIPFSCVTRRGKDELWEHINRLLG